MQNIPREPDLIDYIEEMMSIEQLLWVVIIIVVLLSLKKMSKKKSWFKSSWIRIEDVEDSD